MANSTTSSFRTSSASSDSGETGAVLYGAYSGEKGSGWIEPITDNVWFAVVSPRIRSLVGYEDLQAPKETNLMTVNST